MRTAMGILQRARELERETAEFLCEMIRVPSYSGQEKGVIEVIARRMREAGQTNVERQMADYIAGRRTLYLNVLLAITDWGNAVNSEYQALVQYNIELARLERQTGTILETHGVRFVEERYGSIGPLGRFATERCYPRDMRPGPNSESVAVPEDQQYRRPAAPGMAEVADAPAPEIVPRPAPRAGLR